MEIKVQLSKEEWDRLKELARHDSRPMLSPPTLAAELLAAMIDMAIDELRMDELGGPIAGNGARE